MKKIKYIIFTLLIILCPIYAGAESVTSLYQANIPVASQSVADKNTALRSALQQVLIKVSGNSQIVKNPKINVPLNDVNAMVQEFGYTQAVTSSNNKPDMLMKVHFDQSSIDKLLKNVSIPVWGSERPLILVWAESEVPNQPAIIIDDDSTNNIRILLRQYAERRGLPITFPTMDLNDMNQVSVNDIATMAAPVLQAAAKRYQSDGILILHASQLANSSNVSARLIVGNNAPWNWNLESPTLEENLQALTNHVTDVLAERYATVVMSKAQTQVMITVRGVTHPGDLVHLMDYLKKLTAVADVNPEEVTGEQVVLSLQLQGSEQSLTSAISAESKLIAESNTDNKLMYRWKP
jgi:hypothetical protein